MRIACWLRKATNAHSQYVTLIAFPQQQCTARTLLSVTLYAHCLTCRDWDAALKLFVALLLLLLFILMLKSSKPKIHLK